MKAVIDKDLCTGCELCVSTCPEVFVMDDDDGLAKVIGDEVPEGAKETAEEATSNCPVECIKLD